MSTSEEDIWVGTIFQPEHCRKLVPGKYTVKRKMGVITYHIREGVEGFEVDGNLSFAKNWVPGNAAEVELEILLINEKYRCTQQINVKSKVHQRESSFSFTYAGGDAQRYVRTYFIISYDEK